MDGDVYRKVVELETRVDALYDVLFELVAQRCIPKELVQLALTRVSMRKGGGRQGVLKQLRQKEFSLVERIVMFFKNRH